MTLIGIVLALAAAQAAPAGQAPWPGADGWTRFFEHSEGGASYYHGGSVRRSGGRVQVWLRWDRREVGDGRFAEARILDELDCAARTVRLMRYSAHDDSGATLLEETNPEPFTPIQEGSPGGALHRMFCAG